MMLSEWPSCWSFIRDAIPSVHIAFHILRSCATSCQSSPTPTALMLVTIKSCQCFFTPCAGLVLHSSPNSSRLGRWTGYIRATYPSHLNQCLSKTWVHHSKLHCNSPRCNLLFPLSKSGDAHDIHTLNVEDCHSSDGI